MRTEVIKEKRVNPTNRDKKAVLFLVEQGFATIEQLYQAAWGDQKTSSYAYERLILLERAGFIRGSRLNVGPLKIYQATGMGRHLVATMSPFPMPMTDLSKTIAIHQLDLNEVRLSLESRGVNSWRSAESLIIDPTFSRIGGRHVPDGYYVSSKGSRTAVEYDRTLRKRERIRDRLASYMSELYSPNRSFDRLVYLVSPNLENVYRAIFEQEMASFKDKVLLVNINTFLKSIQGDSFRER